MILLYTDSGFKEQKNYGSCIDSGWIAKFVVSRVYESNDMDFIEMEHLDVGLSTR